MLRVIIAVTSFNYGIELLL